MGSHAITFNAAGINPAAFFDVAPVNNPVLRYPFGLNNYNSQRQNLIDTYSVWYVRHPRNGFFSSTIVSDCPDLLTLLEFNLSSDDNVRFKFWEPDGNFHNIEGLYDLTKLENEALQFVLSAVDQWRRNLLSTTEAGSLLLYYYATHGVGDLASKLTNSHFFNSIYYGMLSDVNGWNVYDWVNHDFPN